MSDEEVNGDDAEVDEPELVVARVEATDDQGRPRILRVFYDDYRPSDDAHRRPHVELPAETLTT